MNAVSAPVRLVDYAPPGWWIDAVELEFDLDRTQTEVTAKLSLRPNPDRPGMPLRLDGEDLQLLRIALDGAPLPSGRYSTDAAGLTVHGVDRACELETRVRIDPSANTRLEGVYASGSMLLTQCEAEGFRRITYFIDRPDVLARYRVLLRADASLYPVLLSNGNPAGHGTLDDGGHWAAWHDPHPKPCYLFALAAGRIACVTAPFTTMEGRAVTVNVWTEPADVERCRHALDCTLRAMRWDEQRFGRAYDLDVFNIVATHDFTMGAMENKGLNIFNARYILADADSATDADYAGIESVIAHEYLHNWSGNRVTLRDWFQLSLKEGLTVFRDQEFSADMHSRALQRIEDVAALKARQFVEDAGPLAHPVRPPEYREINNFYTATVYEKGAEVVRMLHTLLGETDFRRGMDLYFERNDGRAATVEDFLSAMEQASGRDLTRFARWYAQAGTPHLQIADDYDAAAQRYTLRIEQRWPATPDGAAKQPLHVPLAFALYTSQGRIDMPSASDADVRPGLIELRDAVHTLRFEHVAERPMPAFLQGLSAPARLDYPYDAAQLARLIDVEPDALTRWEAVQRLAADAILRRGPAPAAARSALIDALGMLLREPARDPAFVAECHALPDVWTLADQCESIDLDAIVKEREDLLDEIAEAHADAYDAAYRACAAIEPHAISAAAIAARRLQNIALVRLTRLDPQAKLAQAQFDAARTMTDRIAALAALLHYDASAARDALARFRARWRDDPLVTDKWLAALLTRPQPEALDDLHAIFADEVWQPRNPNRVRAVLGSFARGNPIAFHRRDGAGYRAFCAQLPAIDALNPQVAARQLTALEPWRRLDAHRRQQIEPLLRELQRQVQSRDALDVVGRLLA